MAETVHAHVWMHIISFCNLLDSGNFRVVSKRYYYLVSQFRLAAEPQLAVASRDSPRDCLFQLSRLPTLVLSFVKDTDVNRPTIPLPPRTVCMTAVSTDVSCTMNNTVSTESSLMMASFPPETTTVVPFLARRNEIPLVFPPGIEFQVIILYVCQASHGRAESFLTQLQARYPTATIVGGICMGGTLTSSDGSVTNIDSGFFGVATRNMPVQSVVSRGVESVLSSSPWTIEASTLVEPDNDDYALVGPPELLKPYHEVTSVRNGNVVKSPSALISAEEDSDFVGLKRPGTDGFELESMQPVPVLNNSLLLVTNGSDEQKESLQNAEIDFFNLDGEACRQHMDWTLGQLKKQSKDEVILGALMFSCNGRGPGADGLLNESMYDATQFRNHFPHVPCLGLYAGGEIGPKALAGHQNVFQRGKAALQGFTAVFALFIVPVVERPTYDLDDSDEQVSEFVRERLAAMTD